VVHFEWVVNLIMLVQTRLLVLLVVVYQSQQAHLGLVLVLQAQL